MRVARIALFAVLWALLGIAALAGVLLSATALFASSDLGRPVVARALVRFADEAVAGSISLEGIQVLPNGGVEIRGLRVTDPDGDLVLAVDRARVFVDLTRLRSRVVGLTAEIDGPSVLLREEEGGGLSLARAFASASPRARKPKQRPPPLEEAAVTGPRWRLRLGRLTVRGGEVWWVDAAGDTRLDARDLDLDARAIVGPDRDRIELHLQGGLEDPISGPLVLEVRVARDGDAVRVPVLRVQVGDTALAGLAEADLARRSGRAALTRVRIDPVTARAVDPGARLGGDLDLTAYAESDGALVTAAVGVAPEGAGQGRAEIAAATRLGGARALGVDAIVDALDPARVLAALPQGELTVRARGRLAGTSLRDARGRFLVSLGRARLRGGELGPGEADIVLDRGAWQARRLSLRAPGLALEGGGSWRSGQAPVSGSFSATASDLTALRRNLVAVLGVKLPALSGRARVAATLAGTAAAPVVDATVQAPSVAVGGTTFAGARAEVHLAGPARVGSGRVDATIDRIASGGPDVARAVLLRATLEGGVARVAGSAAVPALGRDPVTLNALARRVGPRGEKLDLQELALGYPGTRYTLVRPATVTLEGPRVDVLELAAGDQRIRLEGGLGPRGALDARVVLSAVKLQGLPVGLLPRAAHVAGTVGADVTARGTTPRPRIAGRFTVDDGRYGELVGLGARGELQWDGAARRLIGTVALARAAGGTADVTADLPLPLASRPREPVSVRVRAEGLPLQPLLQAGGVAAPPVAGLLSADATLSGAVATPSLRAEARLDAGSWQDLEGIAVTLHADAPGQRLDVDVDAALLGHPAVQARGEVRLDLADLLAAPGPTLRELRSASLSADVTVPGLALAEVAGSAGVPDGLEGTLTAALHLEGTAAAPRGQVRVDVANGAYQGYQAVSLHLAGEATRDRVSASGEAAIEGERVVALKGSLAAPLERLATRAGLRTAPLAVEAEIPESSTALARAAGADVPLSGVVAAHLTAAGTLAEPRVAADLRGRGVALQGRPLGDVSGTLQAAGGRLGADVSLHPTAGGSVDARLRVQAPLGIDVAPRALLEAPAEATVRADALDLGFLPAALPGTIRTAAGRLDADVTARGPLRRLVPKGHVAVADGRLAVTEFGDWSGITLDARVSEDAMEISKLDARRGSGKLSLTAALRGISSGSARLTGKVEASQLSIVRAGMDLATLDLDVNVSGGWRPGTLDVRLDVPRGVIRLPKKAPRTLQPIASRPDIVVGRRPRKGKPAPAPTESAAAQALEQAVAPGGKPLTVRVRLVAPGRLQVLSDNPLIRIDLKADVTDELVGGEQYATGTIEVVRGQVEPIGGRNFDIRRGKLTFTGVNPKAAVLEVEAVYQNPAATVTVNVSGPLTDPDIRLSSQPPMPESQIALLIATGRTELKPGTGGVSSVSGQEAGMAAAGALATRLFRDVVADKLPLDTVALDSAGVLAGKYVTDRVYVGYSRRFDARIEQGQNQNEVRVEYQITPRWTFESRYGDAQSGGASLVWSKDY